MQKQVWTVFSRTMFMFRFEVAVEPRNNPNFAPKQQPRPSSPRVPSAVAEVYRRRIVSAQCPNNPLD